MKLLVTDVAIIVTYLFFLQALLEMLTCYGI